MGQELLRFARRLPSSLLVNPGAPVRPAHHNPARSVPAGPRDPTHRFRRSTRTRSAGLPAHGFRRTNPTQPAALGKGQHARPAHPGQARLQHGHPVKLATPIPDASCLSCVTGPGTGRGRLPDLETEDVLWTPGRRPDTMNLSHCVSGVLPCALLALLIATGRVAETSVTYVVHLDGELASGKRAVRASRIWTGNWLNANARLVVAADMGP